MSKYIITEFAAITENEIGKVNIHSNKLKEFYAKYL